MLIEKNKNIKKLNKKIKTIPIIIILFIATAIGTIVTVPSIISKIKAENNSILTYEVKKQLSETEYQILITIKSEDGLEYIKYPDGDILNILDNRTKVAIDYKITEEVKYDFVIKQVGKDEVTESIFKEVQKIAGDYSLVNGTYSNRPDLSGFKAQNTRYIQEDSNGNIVPGNWITDNINDSEWYNYKDSKWANVYVETNGTDMYYVWIPRYCYKLNQDSEKSDVKFIDTSNNYKDENGNVTSWTQLKEEGYQIPEAFQYNGYRIPGYWSMKYTAGEMSGNSTVNYDMSVYRGVITIRNIVLNTSITNSNPIAKYTIALNEKIIKTIEDSSSVSNINSQVIELTDMVSGDNVINVTGLNANGEIVGSMTKVYSPAKVNEPDLSEFDQETTFYVTYDDDGKEHSTIPISNDTPNDWYEYGESRWANIVTRNNGLEIYYTWIPRYEFTLDQTNKRSTVKFLSGTSTEADNGYQIPEAFWVDKNGDGVQDADEQLTGYWAMKYTLGSETAPAFDTELVSTNSSIRTKGITGTSVADGQVYKYYINGEYKGEKSTSIDTFEFTGLSSNTKYTVLVEIRNSADEYVGSVVKQISTIDANKPDLNGFNADNTYYVLYDNDGNETIGDKIKNDGGNMPSNWYDYSSSKWANVVVKEGSMTMYYTWVPRYEFRANSSQYQQLATARTEVRFLSGTSKDTDTGYQIPEAFTFNGQDLTGYWAMKYTLGEEQNRKNL